MELLTDRLCFVMKEMADSLISDLISKHHSECLKIVKNEEENDGLCNSMKIIKAEEDKSRKLWQDAERQKKLVQLNTIWGASKHLKTKKINHAKDKSMKKSKSKFLKAAKILVVINILKQGANICTCNSLDSNCKRHDS